MELKSSRHPWVRRSATVRRAKSTVSADALASVADVKGSNGSCSLSKGSMFCSVLLRHVRQVRTLIHMHAREKAHSS